MIGYVLEQELGNALPGSQIASLLTQTVVDPTDPAFGRPTKPIGPTYTADVAQRLASERGWAVAPDGRDGSGNERWRRVVASPVPRSIVELPTIQLLLDHKVLVICAGGGGIPVVVDAHGARYGVEAVVDKDLVTALLAEELGADLLVLLTDVSAVELDWGTPDARPLRETTVRELQDYQFAPGSMRPKVAAAMSFVSNTGRPAAIGALADAAAVVNGTAGTIVRRNP
jgi:carbamate kinase